MWPSATNDWKPNDHYMMPDLNDAVDREVVLGVDTHRDEHVAALLTSLGGLVATSAFPTTADGYSDLLAWAGSFGVLHRAGVECTGSYGAALSRHLQSAGVGVIDVNQTDRADRRKRGKTDTLDAQAAARAVVSGRATTIAKTGDGMVEAIRVMRTARNSTVNAQVKAVNQLKAILALHRPTDLRGHQRAHRRGRNQRNPRQSRSDRLTSIGESASQACPTRSRRHGRWRSCRPACCT